MTVLTRMKNIALFLVSPFIGLAYAIALPFVGIYFIAKIGLEAGEKKVVEKIEDTHKFELHA